MPAPFRARAGVRPCSNSPRGAQQVRAAPNNPRRARTDITLSRLAIDGFGAAGKGGMRDRFWNGPAGPPGAFWGIVAEVGRRLTWLAGRSALLRPPEEPENPWLNYSSSRCQIC